MVLPAVVSIMVGAAAIALGLFDRKNPGWIDSWNANPSIPAAGSRGRRQVGVFAVVLGVVFVMTGVALAVL